MSGLCCLVLLIMLTCSYVAGGRPECRTANCQYSPIKSQHSKFVYYVNGTMGFRDQQVNIEYKENVCFKLRCNSNLRQNGFKLPVDDPALPAMLRLFEVKTIEIEGCTVPINSSYYDVLATLNVNFLPEAKDTTLKLTELPAEPRLEGYHMEGLLVNKLVITGYSTTDETTRPKADFLDKMQELKKLELKQNVVLESDAIERLPEGLVTLKLVNTQLPTAESNLNNGSFWLKRLRSLTYLFIGESGNISIKSADHKLIPPPIASLPNLTRAVLYQVQMKPLSDYWLKGAKLQTLTLDSCGLETLPNNLFGGANITELNLIKNRLSSLPDGIFSPLQWLKKLDLSENDLTGVDTLVDTLLPLGRLEILYVNNNPQLGSLCGDNHFLQGKRMSRLPKSLRQLKLNNTGATRICDDWIDILTNLTDLVLDRNKISNLMYRDLMMKRENSTKNKLVTLSLSNNTLERIEFKEEDYKRCRAARARDWKNFKLQPVQVQLKLENISCDCYHGYWLRETIRDCPLLTLKPDALCNPKPSAFEPRTLLAYKPQDFTCPYDADKTCTHGCECRRRAFDNATVMRCTDALSSDPQWPPSTVDFPLVLHVPPGKLVAVPDAMLVELYAPYNNITNIDEKNIPSTLRVLDVSNNKIAHITTNAAQKLLDLSANVSISGNPLACTCQDANAIMNLKLAQVWDWNRTKCADGSYARGKTKIDMCENKFMTPLLGVMGSVLAILSVTLILRRLSPYIRQFLFDHNMCLKWVLNVKDDPNDPMKTHDVFLSYSYNDYEYAKKLIDKLEARGYSTIEHCRDWLPGKPVSQHIAHSVMSARRTLLLVSDNFANSKWGLEEFHAAHAHAMEHGSARVIVVRCKLLKPHELPPELQLYLYNNTYLDWSDRYFWNKLWRVLPEPQAAPASAIALIPNQEALPSIRIQLTSQQNNATALSHLQLSIDKDPPLSELVLVPPVLEQNDTRQLSTQNLPVTPVTRQPSLSNEKNTSMSRKLHQEQLTAHTVPAAVSPCAC